MPKLKITKNELDYKQIPNLTFQNILDFAKNRFIIFIFIFVLVFILKYVNKIFPPSLTINEITKNSILNLLNFIDVFIINSILELVYFQFKSKKNYSIFTTIKILFSKLYKLLKITFLIFFRLIPLILPYLLLGTLAYFFLNLIQIDSLKYGLLSLVMSILGNYLIWVTRKYIFAFHTVLFTNKYKSAFTISIVMSNKVEKLILYYIKLNFFIIIIFQILEYFNLNVILILLLEILAFNLFLKILFVDIYRIAIFRIVNKNNNS